MVTDFHIILARLKKHMVNDIRQTQIRTTELLVPEPSYLEV
jgi:hypothetical protein